MEALASIKPKAYKRLMVEARKKLGEYDLMELGDYLHCMNGDFSCVGVQKDKLITLAQFLWTTGFKSHVDDFVKVLGSMVVSPNADEVRAKKGVPEFDFEHGTLIFCREYFGLHNFDITGIHVWEFVLAKKDAYAKQLFQRNYERIQANKNRRV